MAVFARQPKKKVAIRPVSTVLEFPVIVLSKKILIIIIIIIGKIIKKIEPKEIPSYLIPHLLVVFTQQLEILVTTL